MHVIVTGGADGRGAYGQGFMGLMAAFIRRYARNPLLQLGVC